jgi:hypothetical protein
MMNTEGSYTLTGPYNEAPTILDDGNVYTQGQILDYYEKQGSLNTKQNDTNAFVQPSWVVTNQIIHAIESNYPLTEYLAGFDAKNMDFIMGLFGPNIMKVLAKGFAVPKIPDSQHNEAKKDQ